MLQRRLHLKHILQRLYDTNIHMHHLCAGLGQRTHADVEAVAEDTPGRGAAQSSQTVAD